MNDRPKRENIRLEARQAPRCGCGHEVSVHNDEGVCMVADCEANCSDLPAVASPETRTPPPTGRTHELKTWPEYFQAVLTGLKTFEVRENDRDFQVGDVLRLREYEPIPMTYTGRECFRTVTYVAKASNLIRLPTHDVILGLAVPAPETAALVARLRDWSILIRETLYPLALAHVTNTHRGNYWRCRCCDESWPVDRGRDAHPVSTCGLYLAFTEASYPVAAVLARPEGQTPSTFPSNWQALIDLIRDERMESFVLTPPVLESLRRTIREAKP